MKRPHFPKCNLQRIPLVLDAVGWITSQRSARAYGMSGNARNSNKPRVKRAKAVLSPVSFRYDLCTNIFPIFRPKPCHASLLSLQIYLHYLRRKAPRLARFGLEISRKLLARKSYSKTRKILKRKKIPLLPRFARHFPPRGKCPEGAIGGNHFFISHSFFFLAKERMGEERKRYSSDASLCGCAAQGRKARLAPPVADEASRGFPQRSKNARISDSPMHFSGTARWKERPLVSQCGLPGRNRNGRAVEGDGPYKRKRKAPTLATASASGTSPVAQPKRQRTMLSTYSISGNGRMSMTFPVVRRGRPPDFPSANLAPPTGGRPENGSAAGISCP